MLVDQSFIARLRRNLHSELEWVDEADGANRESVLASFDRAALATILDNGVVQSTQAAPKKRRRRKALGTSPLAEAQPEVEG